jgi:glycosyltransferase involved in cell wall biosynthesis
VVAPSVVAPDGDMDGIPTVLVEAAALRRPLIASAVSGVGDLVCDGVNGLLVPPGDVDALAAALARLVARPAELQRLGSGGPMLAAAHDARRVARRLQAEVFAP